MYILSKYIIRQHIGPFLFGLFVIILIFILNLIFSELGNILNKGLDFVIIFEFFVLNLAWIVTLAVPMGVLMSCLMAFGRISADNEITALKSNGISLYHIIYPVIIIAAGITFCLMWYENNVLPDANHRLKLLSRDITIKRPTLNLEAGYLYQDIPNISIMVDHLIEKEGESLVKNILIHDLSDPGMNRSIFANNGRIIIDKETGINCDIDVFKTGMIKNTKVAQLLVPKWFRTRINHECMDDVPYDWYFELKPWKLSGIPVYIPNKATMLLMCWYGRDYMTPNFICNDKKSMCGVLPK